MKNSDMLRQMVVSSASAMVSEQNPAIRSLAMNSLASDYSRISTFAYLFGLEKNPIFSLFLSRLVLYGSSQYLEDVRDAYVHIPMRSQNPFFLLDFR